MQPAAMNHVFVKLATMLTFDSRRVAGGTQN